MTSPKKVLVTGASGHVGSSTYLVLTAQPERYDVYALDRQREFSARMPVRNQDMVIPDEKFKEVRETLPRITGKNSNHYANFLLGCKGEEETRSPFEVSGVLTQVFNLGILAQRFGGTLEFDPSQWKITNNAEAQALLDPAPRKGWEQFYKL